MSEPGAEGSGAEAVRSVAVAPFPPERTQGSTLADLVAALPSCELMGDALVRVREIGFRSDEVVRDSLFFCIPGASRDGHDFAPEAVERGARALVVERRLDLEVAQILVPSVREAMGPVSAAFFERPADRMTMVGVTGTNGKTTTTYLLEAVFRAAGRIPGVIGTTGVRVAGRPVAFPRTTPEAPDLHRLLAEMGAEGVNAVAMEVSSHGLHQHRVDGIRFAVAVFTNLSQDHLDYHASMQEYFEAKARLFTPSMADRAVVNFDDPLGRRLLSSGLPTLTFGLDREADVRATSVRTTRDEIAFRVGEVEIRSRLRGLFNVENCLAAVATSRVLGIDDEVAADALASVEGVPGRVEVVEAGQDFLVLIDYAHTPDGLENVLRAARPLASGRVIVVFGCGGDRDRTKRPLMGRAAVANADLAVITSDNPRSEDPLSIIAEIVPGAEEAGGSYAVEPDRRAAINSALAEAHGGDVVVIAGKGHEQGQELADRTIPFDDRVVAIEELGRLGKGSE